MAKGFHQTAPFETGLIIGKFMPPQKGHLHLIHSAQRYVKRLTVLVCTTSGDPIPGKLRYQWMKELFPDADVKHHTDENPQYPHEHPDFWNIWEKGIRRYCPAGPDVVFTSDAYGSRLAKRLDAQYIPIDPGRSTYPISGTKIRRDPYFHWEFIPGCVRPYYAKRVAVVGAESTGKTTLAEQLAQCFDTVWLPEYGREYMDRKKSHPEPEDIANIAREHIRREDAFVRKANRILVCDTELMVTCVLSDYYFGRCPEWIIKESVERKFDLYLLTDTDIAWEADPFQREGPEVRKMLHQRFIRELKQRGLAFVLVSGTVEERKKTAVKAINRLFSDSKYMVKY